MSKWAVCFGHGGLVRDSGEVVRETDNFVFVKSPAGEEAWDRRHVELFVDAGQAQAYFAEKLKSEPKDPGNPW